MKSNSQKPKVLLTILPYWDPMIPPMGITTLKRYLEKRDYQVKTVDLIVKKECLDFYYNYFTLLENAIPLEKRGNFRNVGHDVLQNQMMAHINYTDETLYVDLIKDLIYKHYYVNVENDSILGLVQLMKDFYIMLEAFFSELINIEKPDVIGASVFKGTLPSSLFVLKLAKKINPSIKTIIGGGTFNESHSPDSPSFDALLDISKDYLDKIIIGQGESLLYNYLEGNLDDSKRVYTYEDIGGKILSFEELELPDFSDLDLKVYPCLAATASSSCYFECSFCVAKKVNGPYRKNDPKVVVSQMKELSSKYGHQLFFMTDSLINPAITDLANEFIKSDVTLYYDSYFKVDEPSGDYQNTFLWRKGGLYRVRLGIESGSPKILSEMNKLITIDQIRASIKAFALSGIKTTTYWVIGHPDETEEDFQMTLDLIEELKDDIYQAECNYFLYHYSKQAKEDEWAKYRMPLFPDKYDSMLTFKYWTLDKYPKREIAFERVQRFVNHCRKLGVPNPYTISEIYSADQRWKKLQKNAVPSLLEFKDFNRTIAECKDIVIPKYADNLRRDEALFNL